MSARTRQQQRASETRVPGLWLAGIGLVVGVDQMTKVAGAHLGALPGVAPLHNPALSLELLGAGRWVEGGLMLLGVVMAALWVVPRAQTPRTTISAVLLLGGSLGNLVDRLAWGFVRDFLALGPVVVNLADLAVVTGLALWVSSLPTVHRPVTERR